LASSLANAIAGTVVDLTAKSSPVWTITVTLTARTLSEKGGEETHALRQAEMPSLTYGTGAIGNVPAGGTTVVVTGNAPGGDGAHNIIPPYAVTMFIIRT
jgi:microcystin-dependent protein